MAVKQDIQRQIMNHEASACLFTLFVMMYYFVSVFLFFFRNKYEVLRYLPGLNLSCLSCLCFNFCHGPGYIITNFSPIGPNLQ